MFWCTAQQRTYFAGSCLTTSLTAYGSKNCCATWYPRPLLSTPHLSQLTPSVCFRHSCDTLSPVTASMLSVPSLFVLSLSLPSSLNSSNPHPQDLVTKLRQEHKAHPKALQQAERQRQALEKKLDAAARREAALSRDNEALQVRCYGYLPSSVLSTSAGTPVVERKPVPTAQGSRSAGHKLLQSSPTTQQGCFAAFGLAARLLSHITF